MASYNRVILVGNLTRDIELKYTPGGTAVTDIGMAVNDRRKSASGEWVDETTFVDVTLWGRTAEVASEYLGKGSPILVEGRLKLDTWETDGQKRSKLRVVCDRMQMLSGNTGGGGRSRSAGDDHASDFSSSDPGFQAASTSSHAESTSSQAEITSSQAESTSSQGVDPGQREAQPTGSGPGYEDPQIPF